MLSTAIDDIVSACARFNTMRVVACALQLDIRADDEDNTLCGDQVEHLKITPKTKYRAAKVGNIDQLKYLEQKELLHDRWFCAKELDSEHKRCYSECGHVLDSLTTTFAAENGHLDCLQYAAEHGCGFNVYTSQCAAQHRQQECLQYLLNNDCKWRPDIYLDGDIDSESEEYYNQ